MSSVSDLLERSMEVEHPVTVIFLDEEEEEDAGDTMQKHKDSEHNDYEERTIKVLPIGLDEDETDWIKVPRGSTDWSVEDADPFLTKVNVVVDTDEERKRDDDNDDDDYNNDYDTSTTVSDLFRSTGSQILREASVGDVFLSADDSTSNVGIQGHLTRRKFEVVEHETTRKCIVLAPNTELDSDNEQEKEKEELVATATSDQTAYDVAAALYHSSIKDQGSVLPVVVFKMDSETQTSRNRTTQMGVDQSTMTDEELKQVARKRRRHRQRNPIEEFRETGQGQEDEFGDQRSVAFENDDDDQELMQAPETTAQLRPLGTFRAVETHHEFSDDGHSTAAAKTTEKVNVGQQTASHTSTQTPVLVRLDANGSFWMPQEAMLLAGFENISTGTERFYYPLGNGAPNHHDNQASPRCHGNERSPTREFSTQTFGQMSRGGIPAETQTSLPGNGCLDEDAEYRRNVEIDGIVSGSDAEPTSKDARSRRKHDKKRKKSGHDKTKSGKERSKEAADIEDGASCDELKADLLKLMLHEIKTLKRQVNEVDETNGKQREEEKEKDGAHHKQHRSPRHQLETDRNPDDRKRSSKKMKDSVDRVRKWKKQLESISKNYFDASQRDDLEGRGHRRRSSDREWLSADDTHPGRSRLVRRNDDYSRPGNAGKGRSLGHSSDVERIHRSLTLPPSRGHDRFYHQSNKHFPNVPQYDVGAPRRYDPPRGHHHHLSSHEYPGSRPYPFRPLDTSSPALALDPYSRGSRSDLDLRREPRQSGSPAVGGDVTRSESRRKSLDPGRDNDWNQRWRENVDPNSKRHLLLSTMAGSSRRHQRL